MSPFSQLTSANTGYGAGIDRDFSPVLNYLDEFDRHFSRRHRFVNCFIPRFDLEEDAHNYYLYGDIPGASVEDITVEAHDNHTLVIYGTTRRAGPERMEENGSGVGGPYVKVDAGDNENGRMNQEARDTATSAGALPATVPASNTEPFFPPPPSEPAPHTHHQRRPTQMQQSQGQGQAQVQPQSDFTSHKILLSERLVGEFRRTFAFPSDVEESGVKASMENGVLCLVVPKKEKGVVERERGRKVPIFEGRWWSPRNQEGGGFAFPRGSA